MNQADLIVAGNLSGGIPSRYFAKILRPPGMALDGPQRTHACSTEKSNTTIKNAQTFAMPRRKLVAVNTVDKSNNFCTKLAGCEVQIALFRGSKIKASGTSF